MVRKHKAPKRQWTRRSRPKTPAPKTGWVIAELSQLTGLPIRRIRYYAAEDLIRPLELRGTATRYQRRELLRLLALPLLRPDGQFRLAEIKRKLDLLGETDLERLVTSKPLSAAVAAALGVAASNDTAKATEAPVSWERQLEPNGGAAFETWHHIQLLPGLQLMVSSRASPAIRSAAKRIYDEYVGGAAQLQW